MIDVEIIGAGVAGLCMAAEIVDRGGAVRLVDRHAEPGPHACSWWAGGMLAPWCEAESAEEPVLRFGREAADWWSAKGVDVAREGSLVVALGRDRADLGRFARRTSHFEEIKGDRIGELEPDLAGRVRSALYFPEKAHLD